MDPVHTFPERYVNDYGQVHMPLMVGVSVKCVIKKVFCCSFEFNENWWNCSYRCILKLHRFIEFEWKGKKFFNDTFNG